jgi:D-sedoheptulose 7-phosphate isomerase
MADTDHIAAIDAYFRRSSEALSNAAADPLVRAAIQAISAVVAKAFGSGRKLMLAGNGGSAADAQHIAAEFLSRFTMDRKPLPAIALTTDTSVLTAVGNDYGFDRVFERQIRGLGMRGDVFIAISTSGQSPNILAALTAARELGITTVGMTGAKTSPMITLCDLSLIAPSEETAIVQQIHIVAAHVMCGLVERELFGVR